MADDLGALVGKLAADVTDLKKGLQQGRQEFTSFQNLIETGAAKIKSVLAFAGISLGLYALASEVKEFGASILDVGGKSEVLRAAMYAIGQYYDISSGALDLYIQKLSEMGVEQENALKSVNNFLKAGLSVDLLPQIAAAARDLAPSMAMPFNEAFNAIVEGVTKQTPKTLAAMSPQLKQALKSLISESGKEIDATIISGTQKAQMMVDLLLQEAAKLKGAGDATADSYITQMDRLQKAAKDAKEALFEIVKPISLAITGAEIKSWQDLYTWVVNNKEALREAAGTAGSLIQSFISAGRSVIEFTLAHKDLIATLLEVWALTKVAGWFIGVISGLTTATVGISGLLVQLGLLRVAIAGPWGLVIAVSLIGMAAALKQVETLTKTHPEYVGGAEWVPSEEFKAGGLEQGRREKYKPSTVGTPSPMGGYYGEKPQVSPDQAKAEADAAADRAKLENALKGGGKKGGGGGGKDTEWAQEVREYLKMVETIRQADLKQAESSIEILRASHATKKADLDKQLAEGLIDGQTYYDRLKLMEEGEAAVALALIEKKKQAQMKAHADALQGLSLEDVTPQVAEYRRYELEVKNKSELAKLEADAAKIKLENEKRVTDELKRQFEATKKIKEETEDLKLGTAWGPIQEQEAAIQTLINTWNRAKAAKLEALGASSPEYTAFVTAGEAKLQTDINKAKYGDQISGAVDAITNGFNSVVDSISAGGQNLRDSLRTMFSDLFKVGLKPGLDQLKQLLMDGFKKLFDSDVGAGLGSAVMGVIGLAGMMLTSKSSSSFTPSGVTSSVTAHEAVRGVIAGPTDIPIAQIGTSMQDALVPTNGILSQIEINTRIGGGSGGGISLSLGDGFFERLQNYLDSYFADKLQLGKTF